MWVSVRVKARGRKANFGCGGGSEGGPGSESWMPQKEARRARWLLGTETLNLNNSLIMRTSSQPPRTTRQRLGTHHIQQSRARKACSHDCIFEIPKSNPLPSSKKANSGLRRQQTFRNKNSPTDLGANRP